MFSWLTRAFTRSKGHPEREKLRRFHPARRAAAVFIFASLIAGVFAISPSVAWGVDTIVLVPKGVKSWLVLMINVLTGTPAKYVASIGMIVVLYGIIVRAQRGEPIQGFATIGAAFILLVNVKDLLEFVGYNYAEAASAYEHTNILLDILS